MTGHMRNLLRRLEPPVRPQGTPGPSSAKSRSILEQDSFGAMMALVSSGTVGGSRMVTCACELKSPLSEEQMDRLASATDRAEAAGSQRALMLVDGRGLAVDVAERRIDAELTGATTDGMVKDIDAAVFVTGGPADEAHDDGAAAPLPTALLPPSVARQFESAGVFGRMSDASGTDVEGADRMRRNLHH